MPTQNQITSKPILMSAPMVRAILNGSKTQTRRVIKPQPHSYVDELHGNGLRGRAPYRLEDNETGHIVGWGFEDDDDTYYKFPYGVTRDRLWVRETFDIVNDPAAYHVDDGERENTGYQCKDAIRRGPNDERWVVDYAADVNGRMMDKTGGRKWKPSIHMPRWASRITLEITDVRVQRIQEITEEDAKAEGGEPGCLTCGENCVYTGGCGCCRPAYRDSFCNLWNTINAKRGFGWESNPWVWCISFRRVTP